MNEFLELAIVVKQAETRVEKKLIINELAQLKKVVETIEYIELLLILNKKVR